MTFSGILDVDRILEGGDNERVIRAVVFAELHFLWKCNAIGKLTWLSGRDRGHSGRSNVLLFGGALMASYVRVGEELPVAPAPVPWRQENWAERVQKAIENGANHLLTFRRKKGIGMGSWKPIPRLNPTTSITCTF